MVLSWLGRMWQRFVNPPGPPRPPSRLSESEALQIAQDAATAAGHNGQLLQWTHLHVLDGKLSWSVSAPGIGNVLQAFVDDETGEVVSIGRRPGR